ETKDGSSLPKRLPRLGLASRRTARLQALEHLQRLHKAHPGDARPALIDVEMKRKQVLTRSLPGVSLIGRDPASGERGRRHVEQPIEVTADPWQRGQALHAGSRLQEKLGDGGVLFPGGWGRQVAPLPRAETAGAARVGQLVRAR